MQEKRIGTTLRLKRTEADLSVEQVSDILIARGFKASKKTIYSWENGNSQPTPDALLLMCELYGVKDVLSAFGYKKTPLEQTQGVSSDVEKLITYYERLDKDGREQILQLVSYVARATTKASARGRGVDEALVVEELNKLAGSPADTPEAAEEQ